VKVFRIANRVIRPILASRLHPLLSKRLMLLSYTGAKSGRVYTIPIGYFDWEPGVVLAMSTQLGWIPSMRSGPTVRLRVRGVDQPAVPTVVEEPEKVADLLAEFVQRKGTRAAKGLMLGLPGDRPSVREELLAAASRARLVLFRLGGSTPIPPAPASGTTRGQSFRPRFSSATSKAAVADDQFGETSTRVARTSRVNPDTVKRSAKAG
jgi:hypothetical protein